MTDLELDELLDIWVAPPVPLGLLVTAPVQNQRRSLWWVVAGLAACVLMGGVAFPRIVLPVVGPKLTVDSEVMSHAADGSSRVERYTTSFQQGRRWAHITTSAPGQPFSTAVGWIAQDLAAVAVREVVGLFSDQSKRDPESWCRVVPSDLKKETVLGYKTVILQSEPRNKSRVVTTMWFAQDLGCVPLKSVTEVQGSDGRFRVTSETLPLQVNKR